MKNRPSLLKPCRIPGLKNVGNLSRRTNKSKILITSWLQVECQFFVVCTCVYVRVNNKGSFKKSNFDKRGQLITSHYFLFAPTKATSFTTEVIRKYSCLLTLAVCQLELTSFYPKEDIIFWLSNLLVTICEECFQCDTSLCEHDHNVTSYRHIRS